MTGREVQAGEATWGGGSLLFWLLLAGVLTRGFVGASLLDQLYGYTSAGGSLVTRIAPGSDILFAAAFLAMTRAKQTVADALTRPALLLAAVAAIGLGWALATGALASIGALFDLYLCAAAALFSLTRLTDRERSWVFLAVAAALAANFLVLAAEAALHRRLVTQAFLETGARFRPAALLDHPLLSGLIYATAAPLLVKLPGGLAIKLAAAVLAVLAVTISGARVATLIALALFPLTVLAALRAVPPRSEAEGARRWIAVASAACAAPVLIVGALTLGLGQRFSGGLIDDSALKRVRDFQLLDYLTPHQWLFGGAAGDLQDWSLRLLDGASVESPVVGAVFMLGAPAAALLLLLVVVALVDLAHAADLSGRLALLAFVVIAASNNTLVVKNPSLMFAVVLVGASLATKRGAVSVEEVSGRATWRSARSRPLPNRAV